MNRLEFVFERDAVALRGLSNKDERFYLTCGNFDCGGITMKRSFPWLFCFLALGVCLGTVPASAGTIFTDLGPSGNVYNTGTGWTVSGSATVPSFTAANEFSAAVGGNVTQIDLAVSEVFPPPTFYASIWTDNNGLPGTQVTGAFWNDLTTSQSHGGCCGLVTISGISGVSLTAGTSYFMILGPVSLGDTSWNAWNLNNQGVNGLDLASNDGGATWISEGTGSPLGAFDILSGPTPTPEPSAAILMGTALVAVALAFVLRKSS
jgi:hypothetical protein